VFIFRKTCTCSFMVFLSRIHTSSLVDGTLSSTRLVHLVATAFQAKWLEKKVVWISSVKCRTRKCIVSVLQFFTSIWTTHWPCVNEVQNQELGFWQLETGYRQLPFAGGHGSHGLVSTVVTWMWHIEFRDVAKPGLLSACSIFFTRLKKEVGVKR
jgi:hypothetical protein